AAPRHHLSRRPCGPRPRHLRRHRPGRPRPADPGRHRRARRRQCRHPGHRPAVGDPGAPRRQGGGGGGHLHPGHHRDRPAAVPVGAGQGGAQARLGRLPRGPPGHRRPVPGQRRRRRGRGLRQGRDRLRGGAGRLQPDRRPRVRRHRPHPLRWRAVRLRHRRQVQQGQHLPVGRSLHRRLQHAGLDGRLPGRRGQGRRPAGHRPRRRHPARRQHRADHPAQHAGRARAGGRLDPGARQRRAARDHGRGRRAAPRAQLVRDQAAVRLEGAGAAHQGPGRADGGPAPHLRRPQRGGADDLRRAAPQPPADGQGRPRPRRGPLRVGRVHLGQRRQGGPGEVRGVRPRCPRLLGPQGRRRGLGHRRGPARLGHRARPGPAGRAVRRRPGRGVPALRRGARPDQPGVPAPRRHRHRDPHRRADRAGLGGRGRDGLPDR
ncbi:MAG: Uroporphyrinogen-III methyltransferase / Uroporphyrinogen-III synthase, partial [uncultured Friedmanniella sp.]